MSNSENPLRVAPEPSSFEIAVRERSWDWLLELRHRLKIDLLLIDSRSAVVVPATLADRPSRLFSLLEQGDPLLHSAISSASNAQTTRSIEVGGLQIVCIGIAVDRKGSGVLLIGRPVPLKQDPGVSRAQLGLVASWLSAALRTHMVSPPSLPSSGLDRAASLTRLLGQVSERDTDRELIRLFSEAIAVWHDVEVCGYVETAGDTFTRDVALPGARESSRPHVISAVGLPASTGLVRLPQGHLEQFGLPVDTDGYVWRFRREEGSWLLVFAGAIDIHDLGRLNAYVAVLELALAMSTASAITSVVAAIHRRLDEVDRAPELRARAALDELRRALSTDSATLTFESLPGAPTLRITCPGDMDDEAVRASAFRAGLMKQLEQDYTTTVSLGRHAYVPFTPRDHAVVAAAASAFQQWAPGAFSPASRRDRRAVSRGFGEVLEQSAREAIERGVPVTVVVLLVRNAGSLRRSTFGWVASLRAQMRASDLAGVLADGEIGMLMHDVGSAQAKSIAERLRAAVETVPGGESILIGVASRTPNDDAADGIVHEAHADAMAGTRSSRVSTSPHGLNG